MEGTVIQQPTLPIMQTSDVEMVPYNISTETLLAFVNTSPVENVGVNNEAIMDDSYDKAASELIKLVRDGTIWFPFQKFFQENPNKLFHNLQIIDLPIHEGNYKLYSYYPLYATYLPPRFRGKPITIAGSRETYETADVLSDYFIEDVRLKAKRYDQIRSILECWTVDFCLKEILKTALHKQYITPKTLRGAIYETIPETKIFNPTWAKALLKLVVGSDLSKKKWLDISAGWGDRLLTAMALDMDYTGFDPNIELKQGHTAMIEKFGDPKRHRVIYEPFENTIIPDGPYDVILSSPPYFTIEEYAPGQEGQSIVSYPNYDKWMVWFLFASLEKAWNNLKDGGYLILHLGDARTIATSEPTNIFIENYLPGASWEGVIGLQGEAGYPRPVWIWKKLPKNIPRVIWNDPPVVKNNPEHKQILPVHKRTLYYTYLKLQKELIRFFAGKYAQYYTIRYSSADAVRSRILLNFTNISKEDIDQLLNDNLLISSLLEVLQADNTILHLTNMVAQYPNTEDIIAQSSNIAPYYSIRKNNGRLLRENVYQRLPNISRDLIDDILDDDLMLSSLVEAIDINGTITWSTAMVKLALRI